MPKQDPYSGYDKLKRVVTIKTRKFMVNKLLQRKQMVFNCLIIESLNFHISLLVTKYSIIE